MAFLKKLLAPNLLIIRSGISTGRQPATISKLVSKPIFRFYSSDRTTKLFTRSIVPFHPAATTNYISRFIYNTRKHGFHVDVSNYNESDDLETQVFFKVLNSAIRRELIRRNWYCCAWCKSVKLTFYDGNLIPKFELKETSIALSKDEVRIIETHEGLVVRIYMLGLKRQHVKVSVEDNTLVYEGADGDRTYSGKVDLPKKMYKPKDVTAKFRTYMLEVTFTDSERKSVSVEICCWVDLVFPVIGVKINNKMMRS